MGKFDENLKLVYCEDFDYCLRVIYLGLSVWYVSNVIVYYYLSVSMNVKFLLFKVI